MSNSETPNQPAPALKRRLPGPILTFFISLLAVLVIAGVAGYFSGQQARDQQEKRDKYALAREQYQLAATDIANGDFQLAINRLHDVTTLEPNYPGVQGRLDDALRGLNATPTPMPTSTPVPSPTADVPHGEQLMNQARQQFQDQKWPDMVLTLLSLKVDVPTYSPVVADGLIWVALRDQGVDLLKNWKISQGFYYLDLAKNYAPLDRDAVALEGSRTLFLENFQSAYYYRVTDPQKSIDYFGLAYGAAPNYRSNLLQDYLDTLRDYGNTLMGNDSNGQYDPCGALDAFQRAVDLAPSDAGLAALRDQASQLCNPPVPTVAPTDTGEAPTATP